MNRAKTLVVALVRFYGLVMVFYGLVVATYIGPYYQRYITVYGDPAVHAGTARAFWLEVFHFVLRVLAGLFLFSQAERIIDSLRPPEAEPGFRSLIVALMKLNGFVLLFYGAMFAIDLVPFFSNFSHLGLRGILRGGPEILRASLNLLLGFLVVTCAGRIIDWLGRHGPREAGGDSSAATMVSPGHAGGEA